MAATKTRIMGRRMAGIGDVSSIRFTVNVEPIGAPRMTQRDRWAKRECVLRYWAFKDAVRSAAESHQTELLTGPLQVDISFFMPRQKAKIWKTKPMPRYRSSTKPDIDNLFKAATDSLNGVIWADDSQIAAGFCEKWHCAAGETPHLIISIAQLDEM